MRISIRAASLPLIAVFLYLLLPALLSDISAQSVPPANPGRPTVSTPAALTPVGYLQFETGALYARDSPEFSSQASLNEVIKLAVHPRIQLLLQAAPTTRSTSSAAPLWGGGGLAAGVQVVLLAAEGPRPTVSLSYFHAIHEGTGPDLDIGSARQSALILISNDLAGFHFDLNGIFNEQHDGALRRAQFGQSLSVSHPIKRFTIAGEIWHFSQPLAAGNTMGNLWALSYPVRANLIVDAGFNRGFTTTSTRWELFAGFTYVLPHRLW